MPAMRNAACALACALALAGCDQKPAVFRALQDAAAPVQSFLGKKVDVAEWSEEVLLHDGRTVIVSRRARAYAGGFPNATRGRDIDFELKYEPLGLTWKFDMTGGMSRDPVSFEIFDGVAYLVLYIGDRQSCQGKPPTQYLAQVIKWVNGQWVDVPLSEFPSEKALLNLGTDYWGRTAKDDAKGLIPWAGKRTGGNDGETIKSFFEGYHRICETLQKS